MSFYSDRILPRITDRIMDNKAMRKIRAQVCAGLHGAVLEVGSGSGLNAPHYPAAVERVTVIEPSELAMRLARRRVSAAGVTVERGGLTGERLDLPDEHFDTALSTWTLCTIPDVDAALREIRRVLKPGGTFHFAEHGHAPDPKVARRQRRFEPVQKRVGGGCHLTRDIPELVRDAGFEIEELHTFYMKATPKPWGHMFEGVARRP